MNTEIIKLSEFAISQLLKIKEANQIGEEFGLRVGVKGGGGCNGGFSYVLGFDQKKDDDTEYLIQGFMVYINKAQVLYLAGMKIDWYEGDDNKGFVFQNPIAEKEEGNNFTI